MTMQNIINFFWNKNADHFSAPKYLMLERHGMLSVTAECDELYDQKNNIWWTVDWRVDEKALIRETAPYTDIVLSNWLVQDGRPCLAVSAFRAYQKIAGIVEHHNEAAARLGILQRPCYFIRDTFYSLKYRHC